MRSEIGLQANSESPWLQFSIPSCFAIRSFDRRRAAFRGCSAIRKVPGGGAWEAVLFPPAWGPSPSGLGRGRGRGGAGCARQLCQATALLSKCSAKQQTHKHRMQPSASRWWVLVRAPHSSCLVAPLLSPGGAPSHMVRWWDRAGKQGRPLAGHLATGHHNGHATAFHQICARRASDNGAAHVHMSVSLLPYSGWAEPVKKNAPSGPPPHRAP